MPFQGTRKAIPPHFLDAISKHNLAFISVDYRLAPQTRLPQILEDVSDALTFIHTHLPSRHPEVDFTRLAAAGSSAGGWLSLMIGLDMVPAFKGPKPVAIVALYPITDTTADFFAKPQPPPRLPAVEEAVVKPFLDASKPEVAYSEQESERSNFYGWMVQTGTLNSYLFDGTGVDPAEYVVESKIKSLKEDEVELPPFYINHGNDDHFVPFEQSVVVVDALKEKGATVVFDVFEGKDHRNDWFFEEDTHGIYIFLNNVFKISATD